MGPIDGGPMEFSVTGIGPSDIQGGVITREVSIVSAAANLWTSFARLTTDLCGQEPVGFIISALGISLQLEGSENVTRLDDVFDGQVTLYLSGGGVTVDIGTGLLSGVGPVGLDEISTRETLAPLHANMLASNFNVGLRGETSRTSGDDFSMDVETTFLARAVCQ